MKWMMNPFVWMAILNCVSGAFSTLAGVIAVSTAPPSDEAAGQLDTSNPWVYVVFGLLTILVGVGNWYRQPIATYATMLLIASSFYNVWFGAANADWRFYTLNAYVLVLTGLVIWSFRFKDSA